MASSADELHENHAMAGKGASYFSTDFLLRISYGTTRHATTFLVIIGTRSSHDSSIHVEYAHIYACIYLEFACSTDRGNWCSIFQERGLPVLVFIQQAEQCTGLSAPLPPPSRSALLRPRSSAAGSLLFSKCSFVTSR